MKIYPVTLVFLFITLNIHLYDGFDYYRDQVLLCYSNSFTTNINNYAVTQKVYLNVTKTGTEFLPPILILNF